MALINNIYVFVETESDQSEVDTTSHPTETGLPISDTVRKQPVALSINGKIVDTNNLTAGETVKKLKALQKEGSLITYVGQIGTLTNLQIQSFNTNYSNKNNGGADFDMSLKEIRIAKKAYVEKKQKKVVNYQTKFAPKVGGLCWFKGGYVYVSSDATKAAAKRNASMCKLTKISSLANRKHIYHLISQDCKYGSNSYVYGWVDESCIVAPPKDVSLRSSNGGTQQTKFKAIASKK